MADAMKPHECPVCLRPFEVAADGTYEAEETSVHPGCLDGGSLNAEVEALLVAAERIWADHLSGYEPGIAAMGHLFAAIPPLRIRAARLHERTD